MLSFSGSLENIGFVFLETDTGRVEKVSFPQYVPFQIKFETVSQSCYFKDKK